MRECGDCPVKVCVFCTLVYVNVCNVLKRCKSYVIQWALEYGLFFKVIFSTQQI